jgi:hypothetical protein
VNARLSKDEDHRWALCADVSGGVRFGSCVGIASKTVRDNNPGWWRAVFLVSGFGQDAEGRWRMSRRVWRRLSQGQTPAYRRRPEPWRKDAPNLENAPSMVLEFPAIVVCPACGEEQTLDTSVLKLAEDGAQQTLRP